LYVTCKALNTRKSLREVFQRGQYIPLQINGQNTEHVFSFARREEDMWVLVVVPRLLSGLVPADVLPLGEPIWGNDRLLFPPDMPGQWASVFTGETLRASTGEKDLPLADILRQFPLALLVSR
ncbi:MAG: hypothetical protein U1B77_00065, partial [Dehalococcoidales bacterium]|nr:hypothetical protein [Dehalococcoidales bacterium]